MNLTIGGENYDMKSVGGTHTQTDGTKQTTSSMSLAEKGGNKYAYAKHESNQTPHIRRRSL